jgi:uncharacterized protein (DUF58 family)
MVPKELIKKLRKIEITTRRVVNETLAGQYHSVFKGRGMTFEEVRPYQPGDDIRSIDWNVTARMNDAYVKLFAEERELTVMLLADLSASQDFGSGEKTKGEVAAEIAALLAFSAITNNDRVGLILFTDRVERFVPPKKGRKHVMRLITEILNAKPVGRRTDLNAGLTHLVHVAKRRVVGFLISDFIADHFEDSLRLAARRHDLVPIALRDPLEEALPPAGIAVVEDPETLDRVRVDLSSPTVRAHFAKLALARRTDRARLFRKLSLDFVELKAGEEYVRSLVTFFHARARRRAA